MSDLADKQKYCHYVCQIGSVNHDLTRIMVNNTPHNRTDALVYTFNDLELAVLPPQKSPLFRFDIRTTKTRFLFIQGEYFDTIDFSLLAKVLESDSINLPELFLWLQSVNGMFSGFLYDSKSKQAVSFTDQYGFEFSYYYKTETTLFITSSSWPLVKIQPELNLSWEAVADTVLLAYPTDDRTILEGIRKVLPGHVVQHLPGDQSKPLFYEQIPQRTISSPAKGLKNLIEAEHGHVEYIRTKFDPSRLMITLTGGHDSRAYLNMLLKDGIKPHCLTYLHPIDKWDGTMAKKIAAMTDCPWHPFPDKPVDPQLAAAAVFMNEQGLSGPWLLLATVGGLEFGDAIYFGYTGDPIGGSCHLTKKMSTYEKNHHQLIEDAFSVEYPYLLPVEDVVKIAQHQDKDQVMHRYGTHYRNLKHLDPQDQYIFHRLRVRNFGRVARWSNMNKLGAHRLYVFHDKRLVREYENLVPELIRNDRVHTRLGYHAVDKLKWLPVTHYNFPILIEPFFQRYRELISKEYYDRKNRNIVKKRLSEYRTGLRTVNPKFIDKINSYQKYNLFDLDSIKYVVTILPEKANDLFRKLDSITNIIDFYNDNNDLKLISNLFKDISAFNKLVVDHDSTITFEV